MKKLTYQPAPGYILGKPLSREELAAKSTSLALPSNTGREKDSVGIAEVLALGGAGHAELETIALMVKLASEPLAPASGTAYGNIKVGDLVAYMPFTDAVILDGYDKLGLIAYRNVMAVHVHIDATKEGTRPSKHKGNKK